LALLPVSEKVQPVGNVLLVPLLASVLKSWVYGTPKELRQTGMAQPAQGITINTVTARNLAFMVVS
jgi:hypothetical protein